MRSSAWALIQCDWCLLRGGNLGRDTDIGRMLCEHEDSHLPARERPGTDPSIRAVRRTDTANTLLLEF